MEKQKKSLGWELNRHEKSRYESPRKREREKLNSFLGHKGTLHESENWDQTEKGYGIST